MKLNNREKKQALRARIKDGTVGESVYHGVNHEAPKVGQGHARADVSVTMQQPLLFRLPIDTADQQHVRQGTGLLNNRYLSK